MDFKTQAVRTSAPDDKWDQRKSTGEFLGASDGHHIATLMEFRDEGELEDILTNPDRLAEFIQPGDNVLQVINRVLALAKDSQPQLAGPIASVLGLGGNGPIGLAIYAYDND